MLAIRRVFLWACMRVERSYVAEEEIGIATILHHVEARQTPNGVRTIYAYFDLEVSLAVKHGTQLFDECSHRQLERGLRGYVIKVSDQWQTPPHLTSPHLEPQHRARPRRRAGLPFFGP